jgi:hypothetical protein
MDFVNRGQLCGEIASDQARQSRRHPRTDDERHAIVLSTVGFGDHRRHIIDIVTDRHHVNRSVDQLNRNVVMVPRNGQNGDADIVKKPSRAHIDNPSVDQHCATAWASELKTLNEPLADNSVADHSNVGMRAHAERVTARAIQEASSPRAGAESRPTHATEWHRQPEELPSKRPELGE